MSRSAVEWGRLVWLTVAAACLSFACQTPPPEPVYTEIPQTGVSFVIPGDFRLAGRYPGLVGQDRTSVLIVNEVHGRIEDVRAGMTAEALAQRGMRTLRSEEINIDGRPALMVHAIEQLDTGATIRRWFVAFGRLDVAVMFAASTPVQGSAAIGPVLEATMKTARWDPAFALASYDGLGFTVVESESLKVSERLPQMIAFTRAGHQGALDPSDPLFLAGSSKTARAVTDLAAFSRRHLAEMPELADLRIRTEKPVQVGGIAGFEITAKAKDRASGVELEVYQVIATAGVRTFVLQGFVGEADAKEFMPQFREVAFSLRRVPTPE